MKRWGKKSSEGIETQHFPHQLSVASQAKQLGWATSLACVTSTGLSLELSQYIENNVEIKRELDSLHSQNV